METLILILAVLKSIVVGVHFDMTNWDVVSRRERVCQQASRSLSHSYMFRTGLSLKRVPSLEHEGN